MKMSVPSTIVLVILLVAGLYVMPMYFVSIVQWRNDYENMYTYARELTDQIIDTRQFTETMEEDFNLAIASANNTFIGKVTREVKMVNPDPSNPGETYTSYMVIEQNREYKQGDFVIYLNLRALL